MLLDFNKSSQQTNRCGHQQQSIHQQHLSKQQPQQHPAMSSAYHSAGDDCAINELLEGRMDLDVLMPDGRQVRLTVERRTPMMDLLVQAASATKISPGGHVIHVFGDGGDKGNGALQYKPSTPIGSLDTKTICIVAKKEASDPLAKRMGKTANRPFEPTFRVQVHLPRNQLTVLRVSPRIKIADLKSMVCREKGLDTSRYQLVRPSGPAQPLAGDMTLAEYGSTEITLLSNSSIESHICNSTSHIIPYSKRAEDTKRKNGILRLLTEDAINRVNETTNCHSAFRIDGHHEEIHSNKPEDAHVHHHRYKPKKRRPAPPPPPPALPEAPSHSRQSSSDSSGYHEATSSFLHEEHSGEEKETSSDSSGVSSLDAKVPTLHQQPSPPPPVLPNSKKKKAPAPPPPSRQKDKPIHKQAAPACPPSNRFSLLRDSEKVEAPAVKTDLRDHQTDVLTSKDHQTEVLACNDHQTDDLARGDHQTDFLSRNDHHTGVLACNDRPTDVLVCDDRHTEAISSNDHQRDLLACNSYTIPPKDSVKDPVVLLDHRRPVAEGKANGTPASRKEGPLTTAEFTISTYPATTRNNDASDPIIRAISEENNLVRTEDYLHCTRSEDSDNVEDRISTSGKDHVIPAADHVIIPKDSVLKRNTDTKQKDLPHHLWESEGHRLHQAPQMTVAANAVQAANLSTTDPVREKEIKREIRLAVTEDKENKTFLITETNRYGTSVKKVEEDLLTYTGESLPSRVALVALNARIEQDVTQQEIASSIQAAFHSVDFTPQPSLLAIKQRNSEDLIAARSGKAVASFESPQTTTKVSTAVGAFLGPGDECHSESPGKKRLREREALLIDEEDPLPPRPARAPSRSLKRSSSLLNFTETTPRNNASSFLGNNSRRSSGKLQQLQRSLTDLTAADGKEDDEEEDFEAEQRRLQREYIKLQRQFIVWQQQLMNNHAMLREECIVPQQYARTLRQSHSLPEGEDSFEETLAPSVPLVSRSLSYEPTKERCCSTLPRSAINITSLEFGSIPLGNGTSTLRSSKTKSYFKPPQVRASTKSRQRLPPEIKREGDVDITDDTKMLTTILPSFESLKLISENHDEVSSTTAVHLGISRLRDTATTATVPPLEGRKVPAVHLSSTFPKGLNNGDDNNNKTTASDRDPKCVVNGHTGQSKFRTDYCSPKSTTTTGGQLPAKSQPPAPPPPPPPMPVVDGGMSKCPVVVQNCGTKSSSTTTSQRNGIGNSKKDIADPRDQLMLEIRKFGGRTALRKISLAS